MVRFAGLWLFLLMQLGCVGQAFAARDALAQPSDQQSPAQSNQGVQQVSPSQRSTPDIPRHPLETVALTQPKQVLEQLPDLIASATQTGDAKQLALLQLARANACRVVADWDCQRAAGAAAVSAAQTAKQPILEVRGLIANARARNALQDFAGAEELLIRAETLLSQHRNSDLLADVMLAYSSVSFALEKMEISKQYAERGIALFPNQTLGGAVLPVQAPPNQAATDQPTLVRLLRNLGRAQAAMAQRAAARATIANAQRLALDDDPKLAAELHLEAARLARLDQDVAVQRSSAAAVMQLAERLNNAQLRAQALEVEGLAALDSGDQAAAYRLLRQAFAETEALKTDRDALRIFRTLMPLAMQLEPAAKTTNALMATGLVLQNRVDKAEKAQAATNFEARVRYAEREFELRRLQAESIAAKERERLLNRSRYLAYIVSILSLMTLLIGAWSYHHQLRSRRRLERSERRLRAVTDHVPAQIEQVNVQGDIVFANPAAASAVGLSVDQLVQKNEAQVRGPENYERLKPFIASVLNGQTVSFEDQVPSDGGVRYFQTDYVPDQDTGGRVWGYFGMRVDVTAMKLAEQALQKIAQTDALTGVANRRALEQRAAEMVERSVQSNSDGAIDNSTPGNALLMCLDLDRFKSINDQFGHQVGDEVIRQFAMRLQACVRKTDLVARLGGDEFVILLTDAPNAGIGEKIASDIVEAMRKPMLIERDELAVSTSIGVAFWSAPDSFEKLYELADRALYQAKSAGRNCYALLTHVPEPEPGTGPASGPASAAKNEAVAQH